MGGSTSVLVRVKTYSETGERDTTIRTGHHNHGTMYAQKKKELNVRCRTERERTAATHYYSRTTDHYTPPPSYAATYTRIAYSKSREGSGFFHRFIEKKLKRK